MKLKNEIKDFKSGLDSIVDDLENIMNKIDFLTMAEVEINREVNKLIPKIESKEEQKTLKLWKDVLLSEEMDKFLFIATAIRYMNDPKDEKYSEMFREIIKEHSELDKKQARKK